MVTALILGFVAGVVLIVYRGLYLGPWAAALNTMGVCLIASIVIYIVLQIIASIGSFFLRILLIAAIIGGIVFGGWRLYDGSNSKPHMPNITFDSVTRPINNLLHKVGL